MAIKMLTVGYGIIDTMNSDNLFICYQNPCGTALPYSELQVQAVPQITQL
jgi:hypothetical protein